MTMREPQKTSAARVFLNGLQRDYGKTGLRWEVQEDEISFDDLLNNREFVEKLKRIHGDVSTDELRAILKGPAHEADEAHFIARHILDGLPPAERARLQNVPIGSLPTLAANAAAIKSPAGDPVIVLNTGMIVLLHHCAKAFVGTVPTDLSPGMWRPEEAMFWIGQGCVAFATGAAKIGLDRIPEFTDPRHMRATSSLDDCAMAFIVGHEFGHVELGHLRPESVHLMPLIAMKAAPPQEVYRPTHRQEYDADRRGAELATVFCQQTHGPGSQEMFTAISFFFHLIEVLDACAGSRLDRTSHPPPGERWRALRNVIESMFDAATTRNLASLVPFFGRIKAAVAAIA